MLICASRTKISISAVAFDPSTAVTLTLYQSPRDKQEKGEGRNTTQMILRSPFSCDLLRRDRRVTVKDVDLCEPHQNLDSCGRVRSIRRGPKTAPNQSATSSVGVSRTRATAS